MKRTTLTLCLILSILLSACALPPPPMMTESAAEATNALTITAEPTRFAAPDTWPAGWTAITLVNQSDDMRQAALYRLIEGKTMDDLSAAMQIGDPEAALALLIEIGGPAAVLPGAESTVTVNLQPGPHILLDPVPDAEGVPGMDKGYFMPFGVEDGDGTSAPTADLSVELVDYAYVFDEGAATAGRHTVEILNSGPQEAHEVIIIKLNQGATVQDFLAATAPDAPSGPPPGMPVAGTAALDMGEVAYLDLTLEPGATYALICFLPSTQQGGIPHFMLGMIGQFTVPG